MQSEHLLEHVPKVLRDNSEHLFGVFDLESFPEEIFKLIAGVFEFLVEFAPRQIVFVQQVHHNVHDALNVISSGLVVAPARV